jgi:hypothetical protein
MTPRKPRAREGETRKRDKDTGIHVTFVTKFDPLDPAHKLMLSESAKFLMQPAQLKRVN